MHKKESIYDQVRLKTSSKVPPIVQYRPPFFTFSYTDNQILPLFFYTKLGYQHYPASDNLIKSTDYASFMTNEYLILPGMRFYFSPIIQDEILLMPIAEVGLSLGFFNNTHIFKSDSNTDNYDEFLTKFGFHIGGGFSMTRTKSVESNPVPQGTVITTTEVKNELGEGAITSFGAFALLGVEYAINSMLSLSAEYHLGFTSSSQPDMTVTDPSGVETAYEGGKYSYIGITSVGILTLAIYLN